MKRILILFLILLLLCGCSSGNNTPADIAATTLPVWEFTAMLCADTGLTVDRLITEPVSCLHDYSLSVNQVKLLESSQVIVISGAGLEDFFHDSLPAEKIIDASAGIELHCQETHSHEHDHGHGHSHGSDPHIWLSPANARIMAENICEGLCQRFPAHEQTFRANLADLLDKLNALEVYGQDTLKDLSCRELITFHDGFGYLAESFGLTILEAVEEESGSEASARELIHLIETVREHRLTALFTEVNGSVSSAEVIARETGVRIFCLDMAMSGNSYFHAMYHNINTLKEALE